MPPVGVSIASVVRLASRRAGGASERMQSASTPQAAASPLSSDFRALFESEHGYVCRSLRRLGVREADLMDVAQELFVTVHGCLGAYDRARPLRPWLFSFSLRFAANYRRLARHRVEAGEIPTGPPRPATRTPRRATSCCARSTTQSPIARTVLVMHDLEGFGAPEIAAYTGAPLNTVYSRLRLARADFRAAVARLQGKQRGAP